jgi:cytochrome c oxidase assembly protein subunit 17
MDPKPVKKGICCVCKETKKERDLCFLTKDEASCQEEVRLHNLCLIQEGFNPDGTLKTSL